jgi:hypothetical protein
LADERRREKCGQRFGEMQISSAVGRLVCNRPQLGTDCVLAPAQIGRAMGQLVESQEIFLVGNEQAIDALLRATEMTLRRRFATLCRRSPDADDQNHKADGRYSPSWQSSDLGLG